METLTDHEALDWSSTNHGDLDISSSNHRYLGWSSANHGNSDDHQPIILIGANHQLIVKDWTDHQPINTSCLTKCYHKTDRIVYNSLQILSISSKSEIRKVFWKKKFYFKVLSHFVFQKIRGNSSGAVSLNFGWKSSVSFPDLMLQTFYGRN